MGRQTLFKKALGYYTLHNEELLKAGYIVVEDTEEYTVYDKPENEKPKDTKPNPQ
jgi:hypothetical protein